jgi:hypothetical protein
MAEKSNFFYDVVCRFVRLHSIQSKKLHFTSVQNGSKPVRCFDRGLGEVELVEVRKGGDVGGWCDIQEDFHLTMIQHTTLNEYRMRAFFEAILVQKQPNCIHCRFLHDPLVLRSHYAAIWNKLFKKSRKSLHSWLYTRSIQLSIFIGAIDWISGQSKVCWAMKDCKHKGLSLTWEETKTKHISEKD